MASTEKELEDQLIEAGNNLLKPPSSVDELIPLLDQVESFLSRVEQSPSKSMQNAISPLMKALVANELLRHSDMDVKVSIASCISEITRITAPEAPYDDEQMKEIFQLIVAAFEKLFETSDRSYSKRISILETVAKVRSCVVMLDLECDSLILEMFHHFLNTIRDFHPESVFTSMETIMSLVLVESEDISPEILSPLLTSLKKENQDVLPITRKLAEKVLESCACKLKPYLMQTVESMGMSLNDYSKVVSSICQETSDKVEHNDDNVSEEHMEIESKLPEKTASDEPQVSKEMEIEAACPSELDPLVNESLVTSNGVSKTDDDSLVGLTSPEKKPELPRDTTNSSKAESDSLDSKTLKSEMKPDRASKKKRERRKHNSSLQSIEASAHPRIDSDKEDTELLDGEKSHSKETSNSLPEDPSVGEPAGHSEHGKENPAKVSSPTASHNEALKIASPSRSQSLPDVTRSKRGRGGPNKNEKINRDTDLGSPSEAMGALLRDQVKDEAPPSSHNMLEKESEGNIESEARPYKRSGKKALSKKANADKHQTDAISKDSGPGGDPEAKPLEQSVKKLDTSDTEDEPSVKKLGGKAKKARGKTISEKGIGEPSSKSTPKLINKNQGLLEETPKSKSKRKRTPAKEEASEKLLSVEEPDEKMVGSRIKVWWPKDHTYYEGVIDSFDPIKKKHKVLYVDGDVEVLNLNKQRWEFVEGNSEPDEGQATDLPSEEQIDEKPQKKKVKTKSDSSTKPAKIDTSLKRGKGTSTSKSNVEATNSGDEIKDDDKLVSLTKEIIPKTARKIKNESGKSEETATKIGSKSKEGTSKIGNKSKDDTPKPSTKSKDESTSKVGNKSKDDTPKTSTKSKDESAGKSEEKTTKTKTGSKSKDATLKLGIKFKDDTAKTSTKSKDESAGESEENTTKTKCGSKLKDATLKIGSKSKDDTSKTITKSKDESAGESEENSTKTKTGSKSKDGTAKLGSKSKDQSAGKSKENTTKTVSKSRDSTPKLGSKTRDNAPKNSTKSKSETQKTDKKPGTNGNSTKGKSGSSKVKESEDLGEEKLVDSAKASQEGSETKSGKKRQRRVNG
ncbi:hypothetical protein BVC80_7681g2 [Macleaya cordata]|uniref:Tudor domain n=1 Tax=Macleaya cordata TaxID=56857 RepID=A0A200PMX8_MACCD|nr:hypothetical protein BVC80_7681g2 [Macleaya cordata]